MTHDFNNRIVGMVQQAQLLQQQASEAEAEMFRLHREILASCRPLMGLDSTGDRSVPVVAVDMVQRRAWRIGLDADGALLLEEHPLLIGHRSVVGRAPAAGGSGRVLLARDCSVAVVSRDEDMFLTRREAIAQAQEAAVALASESSAS